MRAIQVHSYGGPEALAVSDVNYIDTYHRSGVYPIPLPLTPGQEGAGTVAEVGEGVSEPRVGDRVAWCAAAGSYAEQVVVDAARTIPVPDGVSDELAAAIPLQGLTAHYLCTSTFAVRTGDDALVH